MLEIRPICEHCAKPLPADSKEAMICSYECTFCAICVEEVLEGVCPNCGGNFEPRPIRPATAWRHAVSRKHQPPAAISTHKPVDTEIHRTFAARIKDIRPENR